MELYRPKLGIDEASEERQKCGNCLCWVADPTNEGRGACRRNAPVVVNAEEAKQPQTLVGKWCFQWEPRDELFDLGGSD